MAKLIHSLKNDYEKDIYRKLGAYCAYQERAESEVWKKLNSLEVSEDLSFRLIALLKKDKFLNEKRFARFYAQGKFSHNKWGKLKIRHNLRQKGIMTKDIDYALNLIKEKDYLEMINKLIEKKSSLLNNNNLFVFRKKIVDSLRIKGYEVNLIWDLVKIKFPDK